MTDLTTWAENMTKEVYSEYKNKYSFWMYGIKVFSSPVAINPPLMIISYQPGGTEKHYKEEDKNSFENGNFQLQKFNSYVKTDHTMSKKVRSFFDFTGGSELLNRSVVFPIIFFRAPTVNTWRKDILKKETRIAMEDFSFSKVKEIIDRLQPQRILVIGIGTYDQLKNILGSVQNEVVLKLRNNRNERMAVSAECGGYKLFAVTHLSGARVKKTDFNELRELFEKEINVLSEK